jgi:hypothetical protein
LNDSCTPIPKPGKSPRRKVDPLHRLATRIAAESDCLLCEHPGCVPAHWPRHRGSGGAKAGWERREWLPLCAPCHDLVDRRLGVSTAIEERRTVALLRLEQLAPVYWAGVEAEQAALRMVVEKREAERGIHA